MKRRALTFVRTMAIVVVVAIVVLAAGLYLLETQQKPPQISALPVERITITRPDGTSVIQGLVYVASTSSEQSQGLMGITNFGNCNGFANSESSCIGMMFVFPASQNLCFWMQNTLIPLQQVWISSNGTVAALYEAQPESDTTVCHPGNYVLETSPGAQISIGDIANQSKL